MRKYIIKRILISIVILFLVAFVIYALMRCLPTSYVEAMARQKSMQPNSKSFEEWSSSPECTIWTWALFPASSNGWVRC